MESKLTIGGQALIEGVMMRSQDKYALAVRTPSKKITTKIIPIKENQFVNKIPIVRGCVRFVETLEIGIKSISYSASESAGEDEKLSAWEFAFTLALSIGMTILLFIMAPLFFARIITGNEGIVFNLVDGIIRIIIFLAYLFLISLMPDIKRVFQYHGAEHMTVHAYEHGEKLTVKNIRKYQTMHPRCGTNFLLIVFMVSIFVFSFLPADSFFIKLGLRLLLLPLIAGISYEFLKFGGKNYDNPAVKVLVYPGILLQKITTKIPEDQMIEVAIKALNAAISKPKKSAA